MGGGRRRGLRRRGWVSERWKKGMEGENGGEEGGREGEGVSEEGIGEGLLQPRKEGGRGCL